jgi:hypothetical protein
MGFGGGNADVSGFNGFFGDKLRDYEIKQKFFLEELKLYLPSTTDTKIGFDKSFFCESSVCKY